jgi:steroid 5-alpha reductase family enzyme
MKRSVSFLVIALIYVAASVLGIVLCGALPYALWLNILIADIAATVFTFVFSLIFKNASVYDPYWSVQPIVILGAVCAAHGNVGLPQLLILIAVFFWGIRLTANWAYTFGGMAHQDWRYTMLKEKTGAFYPVINFVGIHMVPTLVVYGCVLPAAYIMQENPCGNVFAYLCFAFSLGAVLLQGAADVEMHKYRKDRKTPFIRAGLWKYSRHPNYLAEIVMWWSVGLYAVSTLGFRWYFLVGAAANTLLFLLVSIPMADGRQSRKEGFAEYKKQTRMLLPIKK